MTPWETGFKAVQGLTFNVLLFTVFPCFTFTRSLNSIAGLVSFSFHISCDIGAGVVAVVVSVVVVVVVVVVNDDVFYN